MTVRPLGAEEARARFDDLARLRITVFRAWPYLYDGDLDYERRYLGTFLDAQGAFVAGAFDGDALVGAATASPLTHHFAEFVEPFAAAGLNARDWFYFGESVLLPHYRGQGVGVRFFEEREAEARRQGFSACVFAAVKRPADHPARPADYIPLDGFWQNRGYGRIAGLSTTFSWKDIGEVAETTKTMEYWGRRLG